MIEYLFRGIPELLSKGKVSFWINKDVPVVSYFKGLDPREVSKGKTWGWSVSLGAPDKNGVWTHDEWLTNVSRSMVHHIWTHSEGGRDESEKSDVYSYEIKREGKEVESM